MWASFALALHSAALLLCAVTADATFQGSVPHNDSITVFKNARELAADAAQADPFKSADFDIFVLSAYWWPGHCRVSSDIAKCAPSAMPKQWKEKLVVHGLWPSYSDTFKKQNNIAPAAQGPIGGEQPCTGKAYDASQVPKPPTDDLVFPGTGVSNKNPDFYKYQWEKHGVCAQISQEKYFEQAVTIARAATKAMPQPMPQTATVEVLQKMFGPQAQLTCHRDRKTNTVYLWFVNFCYKRKGLPGGAVDCPSAPTTCSGTVTL
ncbi:hypothetical protein P43SY_007451 [Pythium insidiosum]|uniref:Uncharacterized protein n=1 Tax=Pythium insidiosum TaxID=114742 RepID=A0AAD5LY32_PYTIN|nr:hypothetical protein P43SY_007451 [Pythium insidiosum]